MPLDVQISDADLKGFSDPAKELIKTAIAEYASNLIDEANRIEAGRNSTSGSPEITKGMVGDAQVLLRRGLGAPKKKIGMRIVRILAAVLTLLIGISYDKTKLQDGGYMLIFIILVATAILSVTISILNE